MSHIIILSIATLLMLPAIPLTLTPFPSQLFMLLIAVGFGFIDSFTHLTGTEVAILSGLFVLSVIIDQVSGLLGARYGGASVKSIGAGFLGMIIGTIVLPPFGGFIGMFVAVTLTEYANHKNHSRALKAAAGSFLGLLAGKIINTLLALVFAILFFVFAF